MTSAKNIMTSPPITIGPQADIQTTIKTMIEHKISGLPVVNKENELVGVITQSDLVTLQKQIKLPSVFTLLDAFITLPGSEAMEKEMQKILAYTVEEAMTKKPATIGPDTGIREIAGLMVDEKLHTLPVVDKGKLVGVVGKEDVLRTLLPKD